MKHYTVIGRMIGVVRLQQIIEMLEDAQMSSVRLRIIKRELGIRGSVEGLLRHAREILESVKEW